MSHSSDPHRSLTINTSTSPGEPPPSSAPTPHPTSTTAATAPPTTTNPASNPSPEMPVTNGKRRSATNTSTSSSAHSPTTTLPMHNNNATPPHKVAAAAAAFAPSPHDDLRTSPNRRRRLLTYSIALATLVALSSVMERRTELHASHPKIQLSLPSSSSLSSLSDTGVTAAAPPSDSALSPHQPVDLGLRQPQQLQQQQHQQPPTLAGGDTEHQSIADIAPATAPHQPVSAPSSLRPDDNDDDETNAHGDTAAVGANDSNQPDDRSRQSATQSPDSPVPQSKTQRADNLSPSRQQPQQKTDSVNDPSAPAALAAPDPQAASSLKKPAGVNVSDQELKDSVDQLIAHVDQEAEQNVASSASNSTDPNAADALANRPASNSDSLAPPPATPRSDGTVDHFASNSSVLPGSTSASTDPANNSASSDNAASPSSAAAAGSNGAIVVSGGAPAAGTTDSATKPATVAAATDETPLNSQEHFDSAQKRLQAMMADDTLRALVDENDHRTLQALALQATRGDCEQKSGANRSLFKTDAEAADNEDVERTDPLWGAWCLFMGSYKSDAMRDFVIKLRVVEKKVAVAREAASANNNATVPADHDTFDPNAASLDDVLTSDQQSALRSQMETISTHLADEDRRFLAALSLQATFGDCGPYGKELTAERRDAADERAELRKLREPLLDETVTRRAGALWGAWCVIQGKKRTAAAGELTSRVELLVKQLSSKSRAAAAAEAAEVSGSSQAPPAVLAGKPPAEKSAIHGAAVAVALSKPESQIPAARPDTPSE